MKIIKNYEKKNAELFKILRNNLWDKDKEENEYLDESSELLFLIEDIQDVNKLSKAIEDFYLNTKIDDKYSNYAEICKVIAKEYLLALKKI